MYVSFYVGNPQDGGTIIKDLSGDSLFATQGAIPARGSQIFSFSWIAPSVVNTRLVHSGNYVHVWGVIDLSDTMKEIHGRNDFGWSILQVPGIITSVNAQHEQPASCQLFQNYPKSFNPTTVIRFDLNHASKVTLDIYNVLGQEVMENDYGTLGAGSYDKSINMDRFASGVYFYRIVAKGSDGKTFVAVRKLMLLK